jgi:hypothetical protein
MSDAPHTPRYAAQCRYLRMTLDSKQIGGVVNLCEHVIRDGMQCVGPFLDDTDTNCGFWELKPGSRWLGAGDAQSSMRRVYEPQRRPERH